MCLLSFPVLCGKENLVLPFRTRLIANELMRANASCTIAMTSSCKMRRFLKPLPEKLRLCQQTLPHGDGTSLAENRMSCNNHRTKMTLSLSQSLT
jgi:hypothetical protein